MKVRLKDYIERTESELNESLVGKAFAVGQHRAHASNKTKLQSVLSRIQSTAKKGLGEEDLEKQLELVFTLFYDLSLALRINAEMSTNSINVSTAGVLDTESIKKELERLFPRSKR